MSLQMSFPNSNITSTFGSNSDNTFDAIATLYCRRMTNNGPPQTSFHMTSLFRRHRFRLYCDVSCRRVISDLTVQTPYSHRKTDVLEVARDDILEVARVTSWRWQERRLGGGKRDVLEVAREMSRATWEVARVTLRGISSDMVAMGETLLEVARDLGGARDVLEVARVTSWRWQERCLVGGKRDVLDVARVTLRGIISDVVSMGATLQDVTIVTVL
jgi:hypothetical protein